MAQKDARSLYHRWRSSNFTEVIAQDHVTRTLRNAVARGRLVHAYLFCGPRGTGKTSTARILAKAANCLEPQDGEPCNHCASCVTVNEGRAIDLIEIDAASNRGIDDARELREKIKFLPAESRYKVYIIDEAHMLTSEASNALLKTLEEPPDHAILILATTESHKILPTILSRCQRFDFRRIPLQAMVEQLEMICRAEGLSAEPGVLERVARMARGSLRDAESLLDQLVAYCGQNIELGLTKEVLGLTGDESVPEFAEAVRTRDLVAGFRVIDGLASSGADLQHFARELVDYLRALVVVKSGARTSLVNEYRQDELARLLEVAGEWDFRGLLSAIRAFGDLDGKMKQEAFGQIHLEMAFMEAALADPQEAKERPAELGVVERPAAVAKTAPIPPPATPLPAAQEPTAIVDTALSVSAKPIYEADATGDGPAEPAVAAPTLLPLGPPALDLSTVKASWTKVLAEVRRAGGGGVAMALEGARPASVSGDTVCLGLDDKMVYKKVLEPPDARRKVEAALATIFGKRVAVQFQFGLKVKREAVPPERDPVVEAAVREMGFKVRRVEPS